MDEITARIEAKKKAREDEKHAPPEIDHAPVKFSKYVWVGGAILIDFATSYAVWQITRWWWGVVWILAGAGGLVFSEWQRERVGNNPTQRNLGQQGVTWSAIAVFGMGISAGGIYLLGYTYVAWAEIGVFLTTATLFCWHLYRSYQYHISDDDYVERNELARDEEAHQRELHRIAHAAREAQYAAEETAKIKEKQGLHGHAFNAAYGKDVSGVEMQDAHPTSGQSKQ